VITAASAAGCPALAKRIETMPIFVKAKSCALTLPSRYQFFIAKVCPSKSSDAQFQEVQEGYGFRFYNSGHISLPYKITPSTNVA
jgi:hypothetical protein